MDRCTNPNCDGFIYLDIGKNKYVCTECAKEIDAITPEELGIKPYIPIID